MNDMKRRSVDIQPWQRYCYVMDVNDLTISVTRLVEDENGNRRIVLDKNEVLATCNTTVVIDRILAKCKSKKAK